MTLEVGEGRQFQASSAGEDGAGKGVLAACLGRGRKGQECLVIGRVARIRSG